MNVILIPFFLAANVVVKDTSEWTYGPEYLYNMNLTVVIKSDLDPAEPIGNMELISAMKCRPMVAENSLLCIVQNFKTNVGLKTLEEENTTHEIKTEKMFKIKFNERGVESLLIESPSRIQIVDLIRKFANQLSVGVDMGKIGMSHFTGRENISMVNCTTTYKITREELPKTLETHMTNNADFQLVVLPMADARPGTSLTIEKSRMGCNNSPRYHRESPVGTLKMVKFSSMVFVDGASGFETYTEMDMEMRKEFLNFNICTTFAFNIRLNLDSIMPAQDPLPSISNGELFDLNSYDILSNMY
ncbi:uncharacterized protein LOC116845175 [Odontomachus brunneus]|uniref:uncharacterized protein LOC116845175 n=1 Tax=Odontomachus brunneus TaxID=486640 RepID=UPI0013F27439|nr:uncharacterized protein LOC116845175 [Odontomachus brunneus]